MISAEQREIWRLQTEVAILKGVESELEAEVLTLRSLIAGYYATHQAKRDFYRDDCQCGLCRAVRFFKPSITSKLLAD